MDLERQQKAGIFDMPPCGARKATSLLSARHHNRESIYCMLDVVDSQPTEGAGRIDARIKDMQKILTTDQVPDGLLSALSAREVVLWLPQNPGDTATDCLASFISLPWLSVLLEESPRELIATLEREANSSLVHSRGYVQLIDRDPSLVTLPPRSLPIYLLGSKQGESDFDKLSRRMAMLGNLRRSSARHLVIIGDQDATAPVELSSLVDTSFHPYVTFVSSTEAGFAAYSSWAQANVAAPPAQLVQLAPAQFIQSLIARYFEVYPTTSTIVRMRRVDGGTALVDLTGVDDLERPISTAYELLQERDLSLIAPEELNEAEFSAFFENSESSWRPYAAGVPWLRDQDAGLAVERLLRRLDTVGPTENRIAYISSEPGAGGTTLARTIAFDAARAGYPTLVAKPIPFEPESLPLVGFMTRAHQAYISAMEVKSDGDHRLYETPWVIVFDRAHWDQRETELRHFLSQLTRGGRPVLIIAVTGPVRPFEFYNDTLAREIATATHLLGPAEAELLGRHLNRYLSVYGKARPIEAWSQFYRDHGVQHMGSVAAFWIALSFWIRTSRDITGSIQDWVYQAFKDNADSHAMKCALVEIAALSSERLPLNEGLLPNSDNAWPLAMRLEDKRRHLAALGLMHVSADNERYWGLAHDILGRLLLNALFYDFAQRTELGFGEARDAEHLRFMALKRIAVKPQMAEFRFRPLADKYATTIFKIDPDHGAQAFATIWPEALQALDQMPRLLRDTSRVFRHHTAISRRRIATLDNPLYEVSQQDRVDLLERAIDDISYALTSIARSPSDEPDLYLYNSLANAYLNLADTFVKQGRNERIVELRQLANEATRKAYIDNPTNPWVIETHIKNLLSIAKAEPERAANAALEALLAVYEALRARDGQLRADQLARLGESALAILFASTPPETISTEIRTPADILIATWRILAKAGVSQLEETLTDLPRDAAEEALVILSHPAGRGDMQVLRLTYTILSAAQPYAFASRIALIENLQATDRRLSPQLQLEYALLLFQVGRPAEGDRRFRDLRRLWRETEHFVSVPDPLNWLRDSEADTLRTVQARTGSDQGARPMARVSEFGNLLAPFRPEEFDVKHVRPGFVFRAHVSFGHNGPFLRPTTAGPKRA